MEIYSGIGVNDGIAIGKLQIFQHNAKKIEKQIVVEVQSEIERYEEATQKAVKLLQELYDRAVKVVGEAEAMIFEAHQMILEDIEYKNSVENLIRTQKMNAEYAVHLTAEEFGSIFASMEDELMKERAADIRDASKKVMDFLIGEAAGMVSIDRPVVLMSDDLVPSETVQLDRNMVLGFVTQKGSLNSHTAILARNMGIPAIVGADIEIKKDYDNTLIILDGSEGKIIIEPEEKILLEYQERQKRVIEQKLSLKQLKGKESITADGRRINLYANIGRPEDVADALNNDAEGIGLMRSEFLYLGRKDYPTEEEQFQAYKTVAEKMNGKKVIIRTLDIGADKKADYFDLEEEENPALGYRAIRICLDQPVIFRAQLRAIYRATIYGNIALMFPMIISIEEVVRIKEIMKEVSEELNGEGTPYTEPEIGIMIETPAAAMISDLLAKEVDFFSIGTNDLTQYTCAIDRQNSRLDQFYNPHHPAVLRLIELVTKNAHDNGIWVGICGELASDTELTGAFIDMGIDELSVSPGKVLEIRKIVLDYSGTSPEQPFLRNEMNAGPDT